jgi:hypothetical protein
METTFWPFRLAHHAFLEAAIFARAAALMCERPRDVGVVFPLNAAIAVSRAFTCRAALSRSAFNCEIMSMCSSPGEDCTGDQANVLWSRVYQMWKWTSPLECDAIMDVRPIPGWDDRGAGHEAVEIVAMLKSGDDDPFLPRSYATAPGTLFAVSAAQQPAADAFARTSSFNPRAQAAIRMLWPLVGPVSR